MSEINIAGDNGSASPAQPAVHHLRRAFILWAVLSIIGIALVIILVPFFLPPAANGLDSDDNFTIIVFSILSVPVAFFVFVFLGYSLFAFKVREKPTEPATPLQPGPLLSIGWLGITGFLCLFLVIWGLFAYYQEAAAAPSNTLVVQVTAQQWLWTFDYPQYGASSSGAQVIELPVNRPVVFNVTSKDVLHGFAIRALGVRVDANPGEVTTTSVETPTQIGEYTVNCVELCGLYHSYMWESVKVVSETSFNAWITSQGGHL